MFELYQLGEGCTKSFSSGFVLDLDLAMAVAGKAIVNQILKFVVHSYIRCWSKVIAVQAGESVRLNLSDRKLSFENNPCHCLSTRWCGKRSMIRPVGGHNLFFSVSNSLSDESADVEGQLDLLVVR